MIPSMLFYKVFIHLLNHESKASINFAYKEIKNNLDLTLADETPLIIEKCPVAYEEIETAHYSKEAHLIDIEEKKAMAFGEEVHRLLEEIDFTRPDFSKYDVSNNIIENIKCFLNTPLIKENINSKMYKEYEFIYEDDDTLSHGIIDLLIEREDKMLIIDYKLKNILDEAYDKQLNGYREFIEKKTKKKVDCYLYSIIDKNFREVENDKDLLCVPR